MNKLKLKRRWHFWTWTHSSRGPRFQCDNCAKKRYLWNQFSCYGSEAGYYDFCSRECELQYTQKVVESLPRKETTLGWPHKLATIRHNNDTTGWIHLPCGKLYNTTLEEQGEKIANGKFKGSGEPGTFEYQVIDDKLYVRLLSEREQDG